MSLRETRPQDDAPVACGHQILILADHGNLGFQDSFLRSALTFLPPSSCPRFDNPRGQGVFRWDTGASVPRAVDQARLYRPLRTTAAWNSNFSRSVDD